MNALTLESAVDDSIELQEDGASQWGPGRVMGTVVGTLVGLTAAEGTPLVMYPRQPGTAAIAARTTIDLHGGHVGAAIVLIFEEDDPERPIVVGRVLTPNVRPERPKVPSVDIEADGERMIIAAREQLVLKCGKASITLTRAGKVLISGSYVLSHSSGVNRVKGGSIQLN